MAFCNDQPPQRGYCNKIRTSGGLFAPVLPKAAAYYNKIRTCRLYPGRLQPGLSPYCRLILSQIALIATKSEALSTCSYTVSGVYCNKIRTIGPPPGLTVTANCNKIRTLTGRWLAWREPIATKSELFNF